MGYYEIVVQRDRPALFETLARTLDPEAVRRDRRQAERRLATALVETERRREDRRQAPPERWASQGFVVVARWEAARATPLADPVGPSGRGLPPAWSEVGEGLTEFRHRGYIIEAGARRLPSGEYAPRVFVRWETTASDHRQQLHDRQDRRARAAGEAIAMAAALGRAWIDRQHG
jgi:hypothetical protein